MIGISFNKTIVDRQLETNTHIFTLCWSPLSIEIYALIDQ